MACCFFKAFRNNFFQYEIILCGDKIEKKNYLSKSEQVYCSKEFFGSINFTGRGQEGVQDRTLIWLENQDFRPQGAHLWAAILEMHPYMKKK